MPPKVTHTREKIISAAIEVVRDTGAECLNARTVAEKLGCSTQPIMYHFKTIEELKNTVYKKADEFHTEYLMQIHSDNPMMDIGMNYIRFAFNEKNLFRFLFQSNGIKGKNLTEMIETDELNPVIEILAKTANVDCEKARIIFRLIFLLAHGYANMFANNEMEYNEDSVKTDLEFIFYGAVAAAKTGGKYNA